MTVHVEAARRLAADATLTAPLSSYGGAPAVVVADDGKVPEGVRRPFVQVVGSHVDEPFEAKEELGRDVWVTVRIFTDATGSTLLVDQIAERARFLLHRKPEGLAPGAWMAECAGPTVAPTDVSLYGREVRLRVISLPTTTDDEES